MRTVAEIYEAYRIPVWLQLHQLRVAAVGKLFSDTLGNIIEENVVLTCLFHDMGNILKFDLSPTGPLMSLVPAAEQEYWRGVQRDFRERYGESEHVATEAIGRDIGLPAAVRTLIGAMGFAKAAQIFRDGSVELQIIEYADQRVGPHGILSLEGRTAEGHQRYAGRYGRKTPEDETRYLQNVEALHEMEIHLCKLACISPDDINDVSVAPVVEELRTYSI